MNLSGQSETSRQTERAVVGMYSRHPSPGRRDKLGFAARRMKLRLHCCGVTRVDYVSREVLDAGCGTGEYSCWFASEGSRVTGIDLSDGSLREARDFAARSGLRARFEKRSVLDTGYSASSFDFVYCTGVLHHTRDPFGGLRELCRVLRPGGKVLVSLYNSVSFLPRELRRRIARTMGKGRPDQSALWGRRLFPWTTRRLHEGERIDREAAHYDYFGIPHQSRHSVGEVLGWLRRCGLEYCGAFPPLLLGDYPAMFAHQDAESIEARYRPSWIRFVGPLASGREVRRRLPGFFSRAATQSLWLAAGIPVFCVCGRKPRTSDEELS